VVSICCPLFHGTNPSSYARTFYLRASSPVHAFMELFANYYFFFKFHFKQYLFLYLSCVTFLCLSYLFFCDRSERSERNVVYHCSHEYSGKASFRPFLCFFVAKILVTIMLKFGTLIDWMNT